MQAPYELDLESRKGMYGCSRLGVFHGVDPYQDLHSEYLETVEGLVRPPTEWMELGKFFEDAIRRVACRKIGINFLPLFNQTMRHPDHKYHLCGTPDALAEDEKEGGLECKFSSWYQRYQWGPTADDIPPQYELQVRGYMAITRRPRWYLAAWVGERLLVYIIERDLEFEHFILDHAERIWRRYFEAKVRPPIGGSKISSTWLQKAYPMHKRPDIRPATDAEIELLARYGKLRTEQKQLVKDRMLLENQLKDAIKDREGLEWPCGRFTWRRTKDSKWIDWESMAIALRTFYVKDEETRQKLTDDYTHTKPGSRRILFKSDEFIEEEEAADAA
jgi:predicted phage-related endonuclease